MGYPVIPIRHNKKPALMSWQEYQNKSPVESSVRKWWQGNPTANIGIVTGKQSGIVVVDVDSDDGMNELEKYLPETMVTPVAQTPKGKHFYFAYTDGLVNRARVLQDCDVRTDGGYIIAPPGSNGNGGRYAWMPGLSIEEVKPSPMPEALRAALQMCTNINAVTRGEGNIPCATNPQQSITSRNIRFEKGSRDESLFSLANALVKSGMPTVDIGKYLIFFASHCTPPFPLTEVNAKISSALKRVETRKIGLTDALREWVSATWGNFSVTDAIQSVTSATLDDRAKVRVILSRLAKEGVIERIPKKNGWYRKVDTECEEMDFLNASVESTDIWLPFSLNRMVEIMPGNIIVVAGEPNAGKTGLLLNIAKYNMEKFGVQYFNSEMGASELRKRLENFNDVPLSFWKGMKAYERSGNFADAIKSGKGNINIIDFLEIHDNFYEVGGMLADIHDKLKGAIAIVALQKNKGADTGLGGFRSLEKPRLYLSVSPGTVKIVKAKNWKDSKKNPNGLQVGFKIAAGCILSQRGDWHKGD